MKREALIAADAPAIVDAVPKATRDKLAKLGIHRDLDFILHLPLRYVDETHIYPIAHAPYGQITQVEATVVRSEVRFRPRRQLVCLVEDGSGGCMCASEFYPSQQKMLAEGNRVRLLGELRVGFLGPEMVHPQIRVVREGAAEGKSHRSIHHRRFGPGAFAQIDRSRAGEL